MEFKIDKDIFQKMLTIASRFTAGRISTSPILQGVYLVTHSSGIQLTSTNLNTFFITNIKTNKIPEFTAILDAKKILEFLTFLLPGDITVSVDEKKATVKKGKTRGNFPIITGDEFPLPPEMEDVDEIKIDANQFKQYMNLVLFSTSTDESRPVLTSVKLVPSDSDIVFVSTDGFRLSLIRTKQMKSLPASLIPGPFLKEVLRYVTDKGDVTFGYSKKENLIRLAFGDYVFYSRLIDGDFPPYDRVIPAESKTLITADKDDMIKNIKLISVFARDFSHVVVVEVTKEGIAFRPKKEGNAENRSFQECEVSGEDQTIAFNYRYVLDYLQQVPGKQVTIEILRPDAPAVFRTDETEEFMHIIMPIRIQE